jgi:hypothetical protein
MSTAHPPEPPRPRDPHRRQPPPPPPGRNPAEPPPPSASSTIPLRPEDIIGEMET